MNGFRAFLENNYVETKPQAIFLHPADPLT